VHSLRAQFGAVLAGVVLTSAAASAQDNPHGRDPARQAATLGGDSAGPASPGVTSGDTVFKARTEVSGYTDTDHVSVFTPAIDASVDNPTSGWSAAGSYLIDIVSAASVDIVSTASEHWVETRHAATLSGGYKPGTVGGRVNGSVSREPDYLSLNAGASLAFELADKTANPTFSYSYGHDVAGRKTTPFSVFSQPLNRHTLNAALELILDPLTLVSFSVDGIFESGDQSKPYRFLPMFAPEVAPNVPAGASVDLVNRVRLPGRMAEHTPDTRNRFAISGRVAQRLSGSTLVLSERVYLDDWGLKASTTDLRFVVDVSRRVFLWTHLRGHIQSAVSFWHRAYIAALTPGADMYVPRLRTGDRELSPLSAATFGLGLRWNFGSASRPTAWSLVTQADMMTTRFSDALFIQNRQGYLGVVQVEAEF
jgi:hypothetical protein